MALPSSLVALVALVALTLAAGCTRGRGPSAGPNDPTDRARTSPDGTDAGEETPPEEGSESGEAEAAATGEPPAPPAPTEGPSLPFRSPLPLLGDPPSSRFASLAPRACKKEIERRALPFAPSRQAAAGVATPMRSTGPIDGVRITIPRAPSPFGILDCRLALALGDFAALAKEHGVVEIRIDNVFRPRAKLPTKGKKPSQHAYGLAADIVSVTLADHRVLTIEGDWHAPLGSRPCGPDAVLEDPTPDAVLLRNLVCEAARRSLFHHMLSPSSDAAHRDHLHADIKRGATRQPMREPPRSR